MPAAHGGRGRRPVAGDPPQSEGDALLTRRTFVVAGAAAVMAAAGGLLGVEDGLLPGRLRLAALTGRCAEAPEVGSTPLYVACGADDAFTHATERYRRNVVPTPAGEISRGCHTDGYWRSVASAELAFLAASLD